MDPQIRYILSCLLKSTSSTSETQTQMLETLNSILTELQGNEVSLDPLKFCDEDGNITGFIGFILDEETSDITEVFLKEGKIKLKMNGKEEYLFPGDFISYSRIEKKIIKRNKIPQESYTTWKDGTLQMENTVEEIFLKIEEIYGVQIHVSDTTILKEIRKISIPMKDMETVIPILEISLNIKIILDGNKLIIK